MGTSIPPALTKGLAFLREKAISAHIAGDGLQVLHLCVVALDRLRSRGRRADESRVPLAEVRWCFFLALYWLVDDWFFYVADDALKGVETKGGVEADEWLLAYLRQSIENPFVAQSTERLLSISPAEMQNRRSLPEDIAAVTLAIEITWFHEPCGRTWYDLAKRWMENIDKDRELFQTLERLIDRLAAQAKLCYGRSDVSLEGEGTPTIHAADAALAQGWHFFYDCDWHRLERFIRDYTSRTTITDPSYIAAFSLIHFSRFGRKSAEDQFVSLSRRRLVESRQPAQIFNDLRQTHFLANALKVATASKQANVAHKRWNCFRMAMLNSVSALRHWDIGGWLTALQQKANAAVELATHGDKHGVARASINFVKALAVPEPGKNKSYDCALTLLDAVDEGERRALVKSLVSTCPAEWYGAHRILAVLSDSIPDDLLLEAAEWCVVLERTKLSLVGWRISYMEFWKDVLPYTDSAAELVAVLAPGLVRICSTPACWYAVPDTITESLVCADLEIAQRLARTLIETPCADGGFSEKRWGAVFNACARRAELRNLLLEWLQAQARDDPPREHHLRRLECGVRGSTAIDDKEFRTWLRDSVISYTKRHVEASGKKIELGGGLSHELIRLVSWPDGDDELVDWLVRLVDSSKVPFSEKVGPLAMLGDLLEAVPSDRQKTIADCAIRWVNQDIGGRDLGQGMRGPLATFQIRGVDAGVVKTGLLYLLDSLVRVCPEDRPEQVAHWLMGVGVRELADVADQVYSIIVRLAFLSPDGADSTAAALVGLSESVAQRAAGHDAARLIETFRHLLAPEDVSQSVIAKARASAAFRFLLELWEHRLSRLSTSCSAGVRRAVARALVTWSKAVQEERQLAWPPKLEEALCKLREDPRLRVRAAATGLA